MGLVTNHLIQIVQDQVDQHGVVVWFDPVGDYSHVVKMLNIIKGHVFQYDPETGFLALRRAIEPHWLGENPSRLVIYVPMALEDTQQALIEYTVAGVIFGPGQQPPECNTRLPVIARRALEDICPQAVLDQYVADAEAGKLDLLELDELAENCSEGKLGALSLIFGTGNPDEIGLRFLADSSFDEAILDKDSVLDLVKLLSTTFGGSFEQEKYDLASFRAQLTRYVLSSDLRESIKGDLPEKLSSLPKPKGKPGRESVLRVVQLWRQRSDLVSSYVQAAKLIEAELGLGGINWTIETIQNCITFPKIETALQSLLEEHLNENPEERWVELAWDRADGFWSSHKPEIKLHWEIIARAGDVLLSARQMVDKLKTNKHTAKSLIEHYTSGKESWCELDTIFRHLDRDFHYFDLEDGIHDSLIRLVATARREYIKAIDRLSTQFIRSYEDVGFELTGVVHQVEIYHDFVAPALQDGKTAYILVDALRYEMARELEEAYLDDWRTTLLPGIATPPTITEIGMASLMPGAEKGLMIVSAGGGKLGGFVENKKLVSRADRVKHLQTQITVPIEVIRLDEIAPLKNKKIRTNLGNAKLIVLTASDEIDGFWESSPNLARRMQDDVFSQLRRGVLTLFGLGVKRVVITADHGYLSGDKLIPGETIDAPGGQTADLHRRVWVGKGGAQIPGCLRKPVSAFGIGGDFEIVTPEGLACFKAPGGSMEYFHGGMSLQELVIPVMVIKPGNELPSIEAEPSFTWEIIPGSQMVTSMFFSVNITGTSTAFFQKPPTVRVEFRVGDQVISQPVSASYGFNSITRDVTLEFDPEVSNQVKENTITLQLTEKPEAPSVKLFVLDSETGVSISQPTDIPVDIAF